MTSVPTVHPMSGWINHESSRPFGVWEIPDSTLEELARRGFTGLLLIGLWERSPASARIKQMRGNPEATSSAYAVSEYQIADHFGGEGALNQLRDRAAQFGIRLAADMVPNHYGIDSPLLGDHPDWFLHRTDSPFPGYNFTCEDLSADPRFRIQIEDGYWSETDAAVVFRWESSATGEVRFIYHGNDGTHMPWNDTAQLDYSRADVREAVLDTIVEVARRFPIIRFDAP